MLSTLPTGGRMTPVFTPVRPTLSQPASLTHITGSVQTPTAPYANPHVYGIQNQGLQRYLPIAQPRPLTEVEHKAIYKGLSRWWPKLGAGYSTPIPQLLASPFKSSVITGGFGGTLTGMFAEGIRIERNAFVHLGVLGVLLGGACCGIGNYVNRKRKNENIIDLMHRLPAGATMRDLLSDPAYQADLNRDTLTGEGFAKNLKLAVDIIRIIAEATSKSND